MANMDNEISAKMMTAFLDCLQETSRMIHSARNALREQSSSIVLTLTTPSARTVRSALQGVCSDVAPSWMTPSALTTAPTSRIPQEFQRLLHKVAMHVCFDRTCFAAHQRCSCYCCSLVKSVLMYIIYTLSHFNVFCYCLLVTLCVTLFIF